jgi:phospholipase/carboxylesterase
MLTGPYFAPVSGTAKQLIVFLHGYGASGDDLISMAPDLASHFPDCAFVSPDAPHPCEMGYGRQWFGLNDLSSESLQIGAAAAKPLLDDFIDQEAARWQVPQSSIALVGFSQGTMMALAVGLQRKQMLAGILGYSGTFLYLPVTSKPPVLLVHGDADTVVPAAALKHAEKKLLAVGVPFESMLRPGLGHGIDTAGMEAGIKFLGRIFGLSEVSPR